MKHWKHEVFTILQNFQDLRFLKDDSTKRFSETIDVTKYSFQKCIFQLVLLSKKSLFLDSTMKQFLPLRKIRLCRFEMF